MRHSGQRNRFLNESIEGVKALQLIRQDQLQNHPNQKSPVPVHLTFLPTLFETPHYDAGGRIKDHLRSE